MPKIALVDDDQNILASVAIMLEVEGFGVEIYCDGQTAWEAFKKNMPNIVVLEIKTPRLDGMDLLQRIRQNSTIPIMFLTSKDDEIDEILGLRMGADDYMKKPFSQRILLERIWALLRRDNDNVSIIPNESASKKVIERGPLSMDPLRHRVTWRGADVPLTVTEFALLKTLALRPGFVKSRDQLMGVAYEERVYVDDRTIDSHIKRLRKKIRVVDRDFNSIESLYGIGYRFNEAQV